MRWHTGELQTPRLSGQVHVFGQRLRSKVRALSPKNGPDLDFALPAGIREIRANPYIFNLSALGLPGTSGREPFFAGACRQQ
jgi:hypothetical protein